MDITTEMQSDKLYKSLKSFHIATGAKVSLFNREFEEVLAYPAHQSAICRQIKSTPEGAARCRSCDREAQQAIVRSGRETMVYTCHSGLREVVAPITEDGGPIGYMMVGQCVDSGVTVEQAWRATLERCGPYTDLSRLRREFYALPRVSGEQLEAFVEIVNACAGYVRLGEYVKRSKQSDFARVDDYIQGHLAEDLSASALCSQLFLSRNALFGMVKEATGLTLGQYVQQQRLGYAQELLAKTGLSILDIAERCGISDFNYFSRVFKRSLGVSPREYRKGRRGGE